MDSQILPESSDDEVEVVRRNKDEKTGIAELTHFDITNSDYFKGILNEKGVELPKCSTFSEDCSSLFYPNISLSPIHAENSDENDEDIVAPCCSTFNKSSNNLGPFAPQDLSPIYADASDVLPQSSVDGDAPALSDQWMHSLKTSKNYLCIRKPMASTSSGQRMSTRSMAKGKNRLGLNRCSSLPSQRNRKLPSPTKRLNYSSPSTEGFPLCSIVQSHKLLQKKLYPQ